METKPDQKSVEQAKEERKRDPLVWMPVPEDIPINTKGTTLKDLRHKCGTTMIVTLVSPYCPLCMGYFQSPNRLCIVCKKEYPAEYLTCAHCAPKKMYNCLNCKKEVEHFADPKSIGMKCIKCPHCDGILASID